MRTICTHGHKWMNAGILAPLLLLSLAGASGPASSNPTPELEIHIAHAGMDSFTTWRSNVAGCSGTVAGSTDFVVACIPPVGTGPFVYSVQASYLGLSTESRRGIADSGAGAAECDVDDIASVANYCTDSVGVYAPSTFRCVAIIYSNAADLRTTGDWEVVCKARQA